MRKIFKSTLLLLLLLSASLSACQSIPSTAIVTVESSQARLIGPLTQALDNTLRRAEQAHTPDEAERLSKESFQAELSRLLKRSPSQVHSQLQAQAQWTAQGTIQIQLQAQISDQSITAQAQRQSNFSPAK
jgi:hypothetical protein